MLRGLWNSDFVMFNIIVGLPQHTRRMGVDVGNNART